MARAMALAIALCLIGCGQPAPSPSGATSADPTNVANRTSSPSAIASCSAPFKPTPVPAFAFPTIGIPASADRCFYTGYYGEPQPWNLTNEGSLVAFNARDVDHQRDLWLGDLDLGTVKLAYQAPEGTDEKAEIAYPALAGGSLVWLERIYAGKDISAPVKRWSVKRLSVATGEVVELESGSGPSFGGKYVVDLMRFDGTRFALARADTSQRWQIDVTQLDDASVSSIPLDNVPYDMTFVDGGLVYTQGTNDVNRGSMGRMRTFAWTKPSGSTEIGKQDFEVAGDGTMLARLNDPLASDRLAGNPIEPRIVVAFAPYAGGTAVSSPLNGDPGMGVNKVYAGSGTVAWWEDEAFPNQAPMGVLTVWQPGWKSAVQVRTVGDSPQISVKGGWLVWFETDADNYVRVRGVPLIVVTSQVH